MRRVKNGVTLSSGVSGLLQKGDQYVFELWAVVRRTLSGYPLR